MSRAASAFRQSDVTKAVRAVEAAGVGVARVEIDKDGRIIITPGKPSDAPAPASGNEWDKIS
jgi:hypothetical protein